MLLVDTSNGGKSVLLLSSIRDKFAPRAIDRTSRLDDETEPRRLFPREDAFSEDVDEARFRTGENGGARQVSG